MSNPYSDPTLVQSYASPPPMQPSSMNGRPAGVTVFAILCFVLSGFGVLGLLGTIVVFLADKQGATSNPVVELCRTSNAYFVFTLVTTVLGFAFLVVLLMAGLQLWKMSPIGRKLILAYSGYAIIAAIVSNAVNFVYLLPIMRDQMSTNATGLPPAAQQIMQASAVFGMVFGMVIALAFPLAILWYFNRPEIKSRLSA
jgi:hypothetical protein